MKKLNKRELVIIIVSVVVIAGLGLYAVKLHRDVDIKTQSLNSSARSLAQKREESNETLNYIATICAEYRELYQSYRQAAYPDPSKVDKYIGLPGSAKGQIDECYLPE